MKIRALTPYVLVTVAFGLVVFSIYGSHGYLHLRELESELSVIRNKNTEFESEIAELSSEITALKSDPGALEQRAREELGYSRSNELVYVFTPPSTSMEPSTTKGK